MLLNTASGDGILLLYLYLYCTCFHSGSHRQVGAIHLDRVFMATRDATCIAPGFGTENGREKMEKW
jgi:hypothetical protein